MVKKVRILTEKGTLDVELFTQSAPRTVANFTELVEQDFYNELTFHRVIPNFVIQTGSPSGTGKDGPGYTIDCELDGENQRHDRGVLSMANSGKNTGGSQFFICLHRENTKDLDGQHTVFGKVVAGLDILDTIKQGDIIQEIKTVED